MNVRRTYLSLKFRWLTRNRRDDPLVKLLMWTRNTLRVLEKHDPAAAERFRDLTVAFLTEHERVPPTADESVWFMDRGLEIVRESSERLYGPAGLEQ